MIPGVPFNMKWVALVLAITSLAMSFAWAYQPGSDIPPCPCAAVFLASAIWALYLWRPQRPHLWTGHCSKCGYDLTGNTSGCCPECGTETKRRTNGDAS